MEHIVGRTAAVAAVVIVGDAHVTRGGAALAAAVAGGPCGACASSNTSPSCDRCMHLRRLATQVRQCPNGV